MGATTLDLFQVIVLLAVARAGGWRADGWTGGPDLFTLNSPRMFGLLLGELGLVVGEMLDWYSWGVGDECCADHGLLSLCGLGLVLG